MTELSPLTSFPQTEASPWISAYHQARLLQKDEATVDAYLRILRQFTAWGDRPSRARQTVPPRAVDQNGRGSLPLYTARAGIQCEPPHARQSGHQTVLSMVDR